MANLIIGSLRKLFSKKEDGLQAAAQAITFGDGLKNFASLISQHIPYFNKLTPVQKQRFLQRCEAFKEAKEFHFIGVAPDDNIALLVSAAATQLTFGLPGFLLPSFHDIFILPEEYYIKGSDELYVGHVSPKGIHLSWKHFMYGFENAGDNVNVALHELAHALEYDNFLFDTGVDWDFRTDFEKFSETCGPLFADMINGKPSYLRSYAYTNMREFWAVSVETFFETPEQMKEKMPDLYKRLCDVLNQDPMHTELIVPAQ